MIVKRVGMMSTWCETGVVLLVALMLPSCGSGGHLDGPGPAGDSKTSEASWADAAPRDRHILNAPEALRDRWDHAELWFHVPDKWKDFRDGAICAFSEGLGYNSCFHMESVGAGHLTLVEAWFRKDVVIEVSPLDPRFEPAVASLSGNIEIGVVPRSELRPTGAVLIGLDPDRAPSSLSDLEASSSSGGLARSSVLSEKRLFSLLEREPVASPDAAGLDT